MTKSSLKNLLGCLPKALLWNFAIGALALILSLLLGGPKIYIESSSAIIIFVLLLAPYLAITWWSIWALAKNPAPGELVTNGPYRFSRNPMYAAVIFILNPALGILFRSWFLIMAAVPIYFLWRKFVIQEETAALPLKFGAAYAQYQKNTARFFPALRRLNALLFYGLAGVMIFLFTFIFLNFSALYLRWTIFETQAEIVYDAPAPSASFFPQDPNQLFPSSEPAARHANYNSAENSIRISRININAPLLWAQSTSQNDLNAALNQGVILYPGSALPGEDGEVVLSGHSSVFPWVKTQYGQVFTLLDKLQPGDVVSLVYDHRQYDYRVMGQEVLNPDQVKISDTVKPVLKMTTCWPVGTAAKRLVVYGELVE